MARRPTRPSPEDRKLRSSVLALALLGVVGQLSGVAHLLLVPHAVCAEHGAVVHAAEHAHAALATTARESATAKVVAAEHAGDDHDEHCGSYLVRRADACVSNASAVHVATALLAPQPPLAAAARTHGVAILTFAPKCSPPAPRA